MDIPIIFEDDSLMVIDKPPGMVVNKADSVREETVQGWAEKRMKVEKVDKVEKVEKESTNSTYSTSSTFSQRAGIAHRLDKETSGVLVIAKTPQSFENLQAQFKNREVTKRYLTLVHGKVGGSGKIIASVGRLPWNRERFGVLPGGREAVTSFKLLRLLGSLKGEIFSLLEVTPHTGRTHQIRIHLKYSGHSIVADHFYAGRKVYRQDLKFCPRLFLHATYLKIKHPLSGEWSEFESPLPPDLEATLKKLV
ncbi:RluA family pseudouridine synthase [Candidatus Gottesmanbacteria bacterium]|nr:RluA family pseudouridine synthase [Candidatus Gottesmanbacteria bacterium]